VDILEDFYHVFKLLEEVLAEFLLLVLEIYYFWEDWVKTWMKLVLG